jgi:uncharacterized protein
MGAMMLRWIYYAIVLYLVYLVLKVFRGLIRRPAPPERGTALSGVMVKDEACQTYLPKENALREVIDGREYFFCSRECRMKFLEERKRRRSD